MEALTLLGLSWNDRNNTHTITLAWKRKLLCAHPDKNSLSDAVKQTQQLNQAKEKLLALNEIDEEEMQDSMELIKKQQKMHETKERARQEHLASMERMRQDHLASMERMRQDHLANQKQHEELLAELVRERQQYQNMFRQGEAMRANAPNLGSMKDRQFVELNKKGREAVLELRAKNKKRRAGD